MRSSRSFCFVALQYDASQSLRALYEHYFAYAPRTTMGKVLEDHGGQNRQDVRAHREQDLYVDGTAGGCVKGSLISMYV